MLGKSNETLPQTSDSFYDDNDDSVSPTPHPISSVRIVTSKPPIYRRQSESSSGSSTYSDHDVTDVSSIGGEHHLHQQQQQQQQQNHHYQKRKQNQDQHPFHLQSMRHVLLGPSAPASRPSSPVNPTTPDHMHKKHVRIVADENEKVHNHHRSQHRHHQTSQPYIHGHSKDYHRVRLTSSAINRQKQQQRIERENLKILERLQQARATSGLKRDELLSHYDRQMGYVSYPTPPPPPGRLHFSSRPASATPLSATYNLSEKKSTQSNRPSSASHLINSNTGRSRPVSAPTSLHGSSRSSSARRPIWNDRWQRNPE